MCLISFNISSTITHYLKLSRKFQIMHFNKKQDFHISCISYNLILLSPVELNLSFIYHESQYENPSMYMYSEVMKPHKSQLTPKNQFQTYFLPLCCWNFVLQPCHQRCLLKQTYIFLYLRENCVSSPSHEQQGNYKAGHYHFLSQQCQKNDNTRYACFWSGWTLMQNYFPCISSLTTENMKHCIAC